ncbi:hypothetical protein NBRC116589_13520 [Ruegeria sp. HU-ET01832]|uniref:DUF2937 family protein n=1 Tax=Ruegeria sp. HU-ET01832 TaxID=3135906 RepID=UPI003108B2D0
MWRRLIETPLFVVVTLSGAIFFSQLPHFKQQHIQYLSGALTELSGIVQEFEFDARKNGLTVENAINRLLENPDPFVQSRGRRMDAIFKRHDSLSSYATLIGDANPISYAYTALSILEHSDTGQKTLEGFQPGITANRETAWLSAVGALTFYLLTQLVLHSVLRLPRRLALG